MSGYALDSNIISYALRGDTKLQQRIFNEANAGNRVVIPSIVYYEVKRGLLDANATNTLKSFKLLCTSVPIDAIDNEALDIAADIYVTLKQSGRIIDDADILIGASCLAHGLTIVTNNKDHFERIDNLQIEDWSV